MPESLDKRICAICAWRESCAKRFKVRTDAMFTVNCADYTRDISIKDKDVTDILEDQLEIWKKEKKDGTKHIITISSEAGAGGGWVSRILASDLDMILVGSEFIHKVAESAHMSDKVIKSLDEKNNSVMDSLISSLSETRYIWPSEYIRHLTIVVKTVAQYGNAILLGRGANFILPREETFRVRVIAPKDVRIRNIMRDRRVSKEEAAEYAVRYDSDQRAFNKKYFNEDINNPANFNIVISTEFISIDGAADSIKAAFNSWKAIRADKKKAVNGKN